MFRGRPARVACAAGLLLLAGCGDDDAGGTATGCVQVAVNLSDDGVVELAHVVMVGGDGGIRLVSGDWVATEPSLSPDGDEVVVVRADGDYESAGPEATSLWVISIGGTGGTPAEPEGRALTEGPWDDMPAWSPDGTQIAFTRQDWPDWAVMVVPAEGGEPRPVLDLPGRPYIHPTWSPDGERLAVVAVGPTLSPLAAGAIWTVAADGSDLRELTTIGGAHTLDWHPDGVTLLVSTQASDGGSVRAVDVATGDVTILAEHASMATWAPDGEGVYYLDCDVHEGQRRLAYGRIVGGRLERQRFVGDVVVGGHPNRYFGTDTGPCPPGG